MAIGGTSGVSGSSTANAAGVTTGASIAQNFDTFLSILTTQLKNQNPLDPLDTNQFTQQLVQFAGVEQQIQGNELLKSLITVNQSSIRLDALGYIDRTIVAEGATSQLSQGVATWHLKANADVKDAQITIRDASGNIVYETTTTLKKDVSTPFKWDGKDKNGVQQPDGSYQITVTGVDSENKAATISTDIQGRVDGVSVADDGSIVLKVGEINVPLDLVKRVTSSASTTSGS